MEADFVQIGDRIQQVRKRQGKTQEQLAEFMEVSVSYISQLERGITKISLNALYKIAEFLECDVTCFFNDIPKGQRLESRYPEAGRAGTVREENEYRFNTAQRNYYTDMFRGVQEILPPKVDVAEQTQEVHSYLFNQLGKEEQLEVTYFLACYLRARRHK